MEGLAEGEILGQGLREAGLLILLLPSIGEQVQIGLRAQALILCG